MGREDTLPSEPDTGLGRRNLKGPRFEGNQDESGQNKTIEALPVDLDNLCVDSLRILQPLNPPPGVLGHVHPLESVDAAAGRVQDNSRHQRLAISDFRQGEDVSQLDLGLADGASGFTEEIGEGIDPTEGPRSSGASLLMHRARNDLSRHRSSGQFPSAEPDGDWTNHC